MKTGIIPAPAHMRAGSGVCRLSGAMHIERNDFEPYCTEAFFERTGLSRGGGPSLILEKAAMAEEAYTLCIGEDSVTVRAAGERGVIWALTTLYALIDGGSLPVCEIDDAPEYPHRGLSLDCARHFFPAAEVRRIIEGISLAKINTLHWHLSDDQGWRIESRVFPKLCAQSGEYYTQEEIRGIVEYARLRGVEIIPEIDMPGHVSAILAAYPELSCTGEPVDIKTCGGIFSVILCAGKEGVFDFIEKLLDELCPLFASERFHIGGDEAPKLRWHNCPDCRKRMAALGLAHTEQLQGYFTCRVAEMLRRHGKRPVCWNEALRAGRVPEDVQIQYWTLQHRAQMQKFAEGGGRWIYSDMFELYLDYPHSMTALKKVYETRAHFGRAAYSGSSLDGFEACLWSEHIDNAALLERRIFPRIYALAEVAWGSARSYADFRARLCAALPRLERAGLTYTAEDWWDPRGRARLDEALGYLVKMNAAMPEEIRAEALDAAKPSREFVLSFVSRFFRPTDIPALLRSMTGLKK